MWTFSEDKSDAYPSQLKIIEETSVETIKKTSFPENCVWNCSKHYVYGFLQI